MRAKRILAICLICGGMFASFAQKPTYPEKKKQILGRSVNTAVPFLLVSPDARSGGMADIGAASSADANSQHWNAAKYPYLDDDLSISFTYSPWLLNLVPDMSLAYLTAAKKIDKKSTVAFSLLYFSMGDVIFTSNPEDPGVTYTPNEFAIDASYSRKLIDELSIAVSARFIYSNLTLGQIVEGVATKAGLAGAADIGLFYTKDLAVKNLHNSNIRFGLSITNIGNKIAYTETTSSKDKDFLPANLRIGLGYQMDFDEYNSLSVMGEINKLLVPSPPLYDTSGVNIIAGKDNYVNVMQGIFQSFYDSPDGFKGEMHEIQWSLGAEYWYNKMVAVRLGYFHESKLKGSRQYFTLGAGIRYNIFGLDISYLIPTSQVAGSNPLKNTLRFSLIFNFASTKINKAPKEKENAQD